MLHGWNPSRRFTVALTFTSTLKKPRSLKIASWTLNERVRSRINESACKSIKLALTPDNHRTQHASPSLAQLAAPEMKEN
ncbi:hypothetical protein L596_008946 [Steinernema carpocapsae]|uniref:Uncharacterized protein n=1 Tax=Steinernema carpocapsae TaxID=34508 RepID=A0A4U5PDX8_STECR|nr:hypothetical protein L596_008946 [Steinernema carpocapsae]